MAEAAPFQKQHTTVTGRGLYNQMGHERPFPIKSVEIFGLCVEHVISADFRHGCAGFTQHSCQINGVSVIST